MQLEYAAIDACVLAAITMQLLDIIYFNSVQSYLSSSKKTLFSCLNFSLSLLRISISLQSSVVTCGNKQIEYFVALRIYFIKLIIVLNCSSFLIVKGDTFNTMYLRFLYHGFMLIFFVFNANAGSFAKIILFGST